MLEYIKWKIKWVKSTNFLACLTLFFSSILFFYDLLIGRYLLTERDLGPYFIPPRFFWVESIKRGDFPLWNPYQFSGHPFFANPQQAILYPLNSLFFLLPFDIAFNSIIILHFFLGGLFTYILLKDLGVNSTGALISGLIFMLSGYLLSVHSLLTCLLAVIWTPLIMMFFRRASNYPGVKNKVLTAIFLMISFLGGGIEIVYGNFFVLFLLVIFSTSPCSSTHKGQWRRIRAGIKSLLTVSVIFLFLSAVQLLPFFELFHYSIRGGGLSYKEATIWSFAPKDILLFFLPDAYGYFLDMKKYWVSQCWLKTLYTGGFPFILGSFFFLFGKGRRLYLSLMLFSLFLSLGQYNPLYPFVFKYVPFFNGIRYPVKFLYIFIISLSIISGLGFQRLTELSSKLENKRFKNLLLAFALISGLLLLVLILGHKEVVHFLKLRGIDFPAYNYLPVNFYNAKRFLFYLTLFFLLMRIGHEVKWKGWVKVLLVFFLTADLFGNMGFYGKGKTSDYFQKTGILEMISSDKGHFRTFSTGKTSSMDTSILIGGATYLAYLKERHLPSMNLLYKLHDIWGIDVIHLKRTADLYNALTGAPSISATNLVDLYGAKYVISVTPIEKDPRFELIYSRLEGLQGKKEDLLKENTIKLYRNRNARPRAWLVKDFKVMDSGTSLSAITRKDFNPEMEVVLEEEPKWNGEKKGDQNKVAIVHPHPNPPPSRGRKLIISADKYSPVKGGELSRTADKYFPSTGGRGLGGGGAELLHKVEVISESNNRLHLHVMATENAILVLNDTYFPGWKVFIDGKEGKIYRANYNFRAAPLSAGTHHVEFVYDPLSFKLGAVITFLGIIGCLVIGLAVRRRRSLGQTNQCL